MLHFGALIDAKSVFGGSSGWDKGLVAGGFGKLRTMARETYYSVFSSQSVGATEVVRALTSPLNSVRLRSSRWSLPDNVIPGRLVQRATVQFEGHLRGFSRSMKSVSSPGRPLVRQEGMAGVKAGIRWVHLKMRDKDQKATITIVDAFDWM